VKWLTLLLLLMAIPVLAQVPAPLPTEAPWITNMVFTTNEGVTHSYDFPLHRPFTNGPIVIHSPKHLEMLSSLGRPMKRPTAATAPKQMLMGGKQPALAQPQILTLVWDYPTNLLGTVNFEVWHASTLSNAPALLHYWSVPQNFSLLATTPTTSFSLSPGLLSDFFIVRAIDNATGGVSPWNTGPNYTYVLPATLPPGVYVGPLK
jgi:hypothetical protein